MPHDNAHKILEIFAYFKARPGDTLISNHFLAAGRRRRWTAEELDLGLHQALRAGWVTSVESGGWRLTEVGFKEASVATV